MCVRFILCTSVLYTIQHRTVLIIFRFILQTDIISQMLSSVYWREAQERLQSQSAFDEFMGQDAKPVEICRAASNSPTDLCRYYRPKFTLWAHVGETLLFNKFFRLLIHALIAKIYPHRVVWCCADGHFSVLCFQRASCRTFQTCILNSH